MCCNSDQRRNTPAGFILGALAGVIGIIAIPALFLPIRCAAQTGGQAQQVSADELAATNSPSVIIRGVERVRAECIEGRRMICGKVLRVLPDGLVIESGYTSLLRPPLTHSWLVPGTVAASRTPNLVESREPGSPCVGTVFLSDLPKSRKTRGRKPKPFDYIILLGYPAGEYTYTSVGTVQKTVRHFTGALAPAVKTQIAKIKWTAVQLRMPANTNGAIPKLLSQTGAFRDVKNLEPEDYLLPYDLNVPFWSDGAEKKRWICVPPGEVIHFEPTGEWKFPPGTIFVKHFELAAEGNSTRLHRLETRLLVCDDSGGVYGVTYKWRPDSSDADLLETNLTEDITISTANGMHTQQWYYPSRADCLTCHTANAGLVLGVKTRQLNRVFDYADGKRENELVAWRYRRLFDADFSDVEVTRFPRLAPMDDEARSLEDRARSYLDANCAQCHRPNGTVANFDARYDTPPVEQNIVGGHVLIDERIDGARVVAPHDLWRSILLMRVDTTDAYKMPPIARNRVDERGVKLLRDWIEGLPGPPVLPPPEILPPGGNFTTPVKVSLESEPGTSVFYTVNGTVPTTNDLLYSGPFTVAEPTIVRAKAFKAGCTRSITSQQFFLFNH